MATRGKSKSNDIVVFSIVRETECSECGAELWKGALLKKEGDGVLCLSCADLDHLVFLPSGDAALTRRASKYSTLRAVVVRFARARKRYERQGVLVEEAALDRAEQECLDDADARALRREREAERREVLDAKYVAEFARHVRKRYPACPPNEENAIAEHACAKYSGRVGRSADAKKLEPQMIDLAVVAHVRHVHTDYDRLLAEGWERLEARDRISFDVDSVLRQWRSESIETDSGGVS